jgi:prepilin-type N-terminal cleavage/methylation domain-containing protein
MRKVGDNCRRTGSGGGTTPAAFSLVELVLVIVIIGIVAAIAIPRFAQSTMRSRAHQVAMNLKILNEAIDRYHADHGNYPGPNLEDETITQNGEQLIFRTNPAGCTEQETCFTVNLVYGPYLRAIPDNPFVDESFPVYTSGNPFNPEDGGILDLTGWYFDHETGACNVSLYNSDVTHADLQALVSAPIAYLPWCDACDPP